ncbi:glycosyltransferase [soil metagenome]
MRVLLSTIGSRGDVQPLVALAMELRALEQDVRMCVPPDFRESIEELGFAVTPIGPELRAFSVGIPAPGAAPITPERAREMVDASVAAQFEAIAGAATDCDVIVGATALQIAAPSVAEKLGIPYIFAAYCPAVLPSPHQRPIVLGMRGEVEPPASADDTELWAREAQRYNDTFGAALNTHRESIGMSPVDDVRSYILTSRPWLAADPMLGPWPDPADAAVFQPGAWIVADHRPLSPELEAFLDAGDQPVYFGFGSIRSAGDVSRAMIESARALGRRAIVSRGWADLALVDDQPDCLSIGEVNQQALFGRVAAVVHHGGAGTTATAALAGAPQVIVPQMYDQRYWAKRVQEIGIGTAHPAGAPTADSLTNALDRSLHADVMARAHTVATAVIRTGARVAAERVIAIAG